MRAKSLSLVWIAVKDFKQAVKFYTEVVGLKLMENNEEFGWAELQGQEGGTRLGIAKLPEENIFKPGQNAVVTFTVENIDKAVEELKAKGAKCLGKLEKIEGHVKIQMVVDLDGNHFQLAQILHK